MSPLDTKALAAIALLWGRKDTWSVITYGDLAARLGHAQQGLGEILNRVGAWCGSINKQSLAMLVIGAEGNPHSGMFSPFRGEDDPVTKENYERRRVDLWPGRCGQGEASVLRQKSRAPIASRKRS